MDCSHHFEASSQNPWHSRASGQNPGHFEANRQNPCHSKTSEAIGESFTAKKQEPSSSSALGPGDMVSLYIHIPFCKQRCAYCDFYTKAIPADSPELDAYTELLIRQIRESSRADRLGKIETIYIGGGTPSFLGSKRLINLVYTLSLSINLTAQTEFTVEANPESLTAPMVRDLFALGVNRVSLGVQSFLDSELAALGRVHDAQLARSAVAIAQGRFSNVSLDLICGIPLQTMESWRYSLETAIALGVQQISVYPLTIEAGTALNDDVRSKKISVASEDVQADMMELAADLLTKAGYYRYEVASYAKPGFECQHNLSYWTGKSYLGLGRGAAGMQNLEDGSRQRSFDGQISETLTPKQAAAEDLMLAMRTAEGVSVEQLCSTRGLTSDAMLPEAAKTFAGLLELGLVKIVSTTDGTRRYVPTEKGWLMGNELYSRIWDLAG